MVLAPEALPLAVPAGGHQTLAVDPKDLGPVTAEIGALLASGNVSGVVVEHAPLYLPLGKSPGALLAIAQNHETCSRLAERIAVECKTRGVPCFVLPRASWAHRVVPHTRGGITDLMANEGLLVHVDPESWGRLADQDQRDAAGVLVGHLLPAPRRLLAARRGKLRDRRKDQSTPHPSLLTPEAREGLRAARHAAALPRLRERKRLTMRRLRGTAERAAACRCGPGGQPRDVSTRGRHKAACPAAPPPKGWTQALSDAYVPMCK